MGPKTKSLACQLADLPDPRKVRGQRHILLDILLIAILAELCGADSWEDIYRFGKSQETWLATFLALPHGIPSADTFNRVFLLIEPRAFERLDSDLAATPHFTTEALETTRGRNEVRRVTTLDALKHLPEDILFGWPKLETLVRIESAAKRGGKTVSETRYFISTLPMREVESIGQGIRSHWGIENRLHWVLDVAFREDGNRTRKGNGPECSAILRHIVLNLLRQDPNPMGSIKFRRLQAAMSPDYRLAALLGFPRGGGPGLQSGQGEAPAISSRT